LNEMLAVFFYLSKRLFKIQKC